MNNTNLTVESCFEHAEELIPERWDTRPEMIKDKRAFNPFNLGPYTLYEHPRVTLFECSTLMA